MSVMDEMGERNLEIDIVEGVLAKLLVIEGLSLCS